MERGIRKKVTPMKEELYKIASRALIAAMANRGWDAGTLSRLSGVGVSTIRRMTGEYRPKNMSLERAEYCRKLIGIKLAVALRCKPQVILPELPLPMPQAKGPDPPTDYAPPEPGLNDWRTHAVARAYKKRLSDAVASEITPDEVA